MKIQIMKSYRFFCMMNFYHWPLSWTCSKQNRIAFAVRASNWLFKRYFKIISPINMFRTVISKKVKINVFLLACDVVTLQKVLIDGAAR